MAIDNPYHREKQRGDTFAIRARLARERDKPMTLDQLADLYETHPEKAAEIHQSGNYTDNEGDSK